MGAARTEFAAALSAEEQNHPHAAIKHYISCLEHLTNNPFNHTDDDDNEQSHQNSELAALKQMSFERLKVLTKIATAGSVENTHFADSKSERNLHAGAMRRSVSAEVASALQATRRQHEREALKSMPSAAPSKNPSPTNPTNTGSNNNEGAKRDVDKNSRQQRAPQPQIIQKMLVSRQSTARPRKTPAMSQNFFTRLIFGTTQQERQEKKTLQDFAGDVAEELVSLDAPSTNRHIDNRRIDDPRYCGCFALEDLPIKSVRACFEELPGLKEITEDFLRRQHMHLTNFTKTSSSLNNIHLNITNYDVDKDGLEKALTEWHQFEECFVQGCLQAACPALEHPRAEGRVRMAVQQYVLDECSNMGHALFLAMQCRPSVMNRQQALNRAILSNLLMQQDTRKEETPTVNSRHSTCCHSSSSIMGGVWSRLNDIHLTLKALASTQPHQNPPQKPPRNSIDEGAEVCTTMGLGAEDLLDAFLKHYFHYSPKCDDNGDVSGGDNIGLSNFASSLVVADVELAEALCPVGWLRGTAGYVLATVQAAIDANISTADDTCSSRSNPS